MQFLSDEITEFTKSVWESVLDSAISPVAEVPDPTSAGANLMSWVQISGEWHGALVIHLGGDAALAAAGAMLEMQPDEIAPDELADVAGELANMIGGNVKALLPQPASLGLPNVVEGKEFSMHLPGSHEITRIGFEWSGSAVVVALMQAD
ncbi:MAG: hypothetical protein CL908_14745 [Deltaproteobacteria bacterium]|nr:hypothetical protein [Deltaproteobacteria bacterium]